MKQRNAIASMSLYSYTTTHMYLLRHIVGWLRLTGYISNLEIAKLRSYATVTAYLSEEHGNVTVMRTKCVYCQHHQHGILFVSVATFMIGSHFIVFLYSSNSTIK